MPPLTSARDQNPALQWAGQIVFRECSHTGCGWNDSPGDIPHLSSGRDPCRNWSPPASASFATFAIFATLAIFAKFAKFAIFITFIIFIIFIIFITFNPAVEFPSWERRHSCVIPQVDDPVAMIRAHSTFLCPTLSGEGLGSAGVRAFAGFRGTALNSV
jgi:hypothetical protein